MVYSSESYSSLSDDTSENTSLKSSDASDGGVSSYAPTFTGGGGESAISDSESVGSVKDHLPMFGQRLIEVEESDQRFELLKQRFVSGLGPALGSMVNVVAVHRNSHSGVMGQARIRAFQVFVRALARKNGGDLNMKYAWVGCSRDEVDGVFRYGFGSTGNNGLYGHGLYLSPAEAPIESVRTLGVDAEGLRHVVLCRVLLGRVEYVQPVSDQRSPSSEEFDSGVDNVDSPKKYIVWSANMNTHVLPEYVVSFKAPASLRAMLDPQMPSSPWMPFHELTEVLADYLPPVNLAAIRKMHVAFMAKRISRHDMIQKMRQLTGDKLLIAILNSSNSKPTHGSSFSKLSSRLNTHAPNLMSRLNAMARQNTASAVPLPASSSQQAAEAFNQASMPKT